MKNLYLIFLLFTMRVSAQFKNRDNSKVWHLIIADSISKIGISRAAVSVSRSDVFVTDDGGIINIPKVKITSNVLVSISSMGYKTVVCHISTNYPDSIKLLPSLLPLKEVKISPAKELLVLGTIDRLKEKGGYSSGPNQEIAEYIPNNNKISADIISVEFAINNEKKGIKNPFKLNLYAKKKDSMYPDSSIIKDSIVVFNPTGQTIVNVDISKYNIKFPVEGIFIGFETLSPSWYGIGTVKLGDGQYYLRVPGIKGHFKNHQFNFDDTKREGVGYGLYRDIGSIDSWAIFENGTDFDMDVVLRPD